MFLSVGCFKGLASTIYPLSIAYANDYLGPNDVMSASSDFALSFSLGAVVGLLVSSSLMSILGPGGLFLFTSLALLTLSGFILWRLGIRQWAPVSEKERFVALPEAPAPTVIDLDPRTETSAQ